MGGPAPLFSDAWTYQYNTPNPTSGSDAVVHLAENWMMFDGINTGWVLGPSRLPQGRASWWHGTIYMTHRSLSLRFNGTGTFTPQTQAELAFASELIAYWFLFVRSGNPNTYKLDMPPTWEQYTPRNKFRMILMQDCQNLTTVSGSHMEEQPAGEGEKCAFAVSKVSHIED